MPSGFKEELVGKVINGMTVLSESKKESTGKLYLNMKEQGRNKSNNVYLTINGRTEVLPVWSEISGVAQGTIRRRLRKGFSHEDCIKPVGSFDHRIKLFPKWSEFE